jgi:hypothetical protein
VRAGISRLVCDHFAYADAYDSATERYLGLHATSAGLVPILFDDAAVIVKPEAANARLAREGIAQVQPGYPEGANRPSSVGGNDPISSPPRTTVFHRFYGSFEFEPDRMVREAGAWPQTRAAGAEGAK